MKTTMNSAAAEIRFITTPALITTRRLETEQFWYESGAPDTAPGLRSSWPSILTYPPSGSRLRRYSVAPIGHAPSGCFSSAAWYCSSLDPRRSPIPLRYDTSTRPNPSENASTRIPAHLAATKCPSSWMKTIAPNPITMTRKFRTDPIGPPMSNMGRSGVLGECIARRGENPGRLRSGTGTKKPGRSRVQGSKRSERGKGPVGISCT